MKTEVTNQGILITDVECFDPQLSCMCGQAFRWSVSPEGVLHGVVGRSAVDIVKKDGGYLFCGIDKSAFENTWREYFDLDRDYAEICEKLSADGYLQKAIKQYYGIRILKQNPWEALCSFIISQNNNIPRISGIIKRFCEAFGDELSNGEYTFPDYSVISGLSPEDLAPLRAGFRARYIIDAANRLENGEITLDDIYTMPMSQARTELMKITGVGAKVAECTLLYGFMRTEAFPIDVWVKRIMAELYPEGLPECTAGVEGIAQQYLFHWRRNLDSEQTA